MRAALRRERLEHHGAHYDIPVSGGTGLGKPLRLMVRPLRAEIPIYLAAIGTKSVELAFEIADGWLPIFWSPEQARSVFPLERARPGFDIAPCVPAVLTDDVESGRAALKEYYSFYVGGMGARGTNFYNDLFARYGYESEAREIQELFLGGQQREAASKVPDAFVDEVALVGSKERIADRLAAWRDSGATTMLVSTRDVATLRAVAEAAAQFGARPGSDPGGTGATGPPATPGLGPADRQLVGTALCKRCSAPPVAVRSTKTLTVRCAGRGQARV